MKIRTGLWLLISISIISCKQKSTKKSENSTIPKIVNINNKKAYAEFEKMHLDSTYSNLLDPRNSTESEFKEVVKSWSDFHNKIFKYMKDENFKWEIPDSAIKVSTEFILIKTVMSNTTPLRC